FLSTIACDTPTASTATASTPAIPHADQIEGIQQQLAESKREKIRRSASYKALLVECVTALENSYEPGKKLNLCPQHDHPSNVIETVRFDLLKHGWSTERTRQGNLSVLV